MAHAVMSQFKSPSLPSELHITILRRFLETGVAAEHIHSYCSVEGVWLGFLWQRQCSVDGDFFKKKSAQSDDKISVITKLSQP